SSDKRASSMATPKRTSCDPRVVMRRIVSAIAALPHAVAGSRTKAVSGHIGDRLRRWVRLACALAVAALLAAPLLFGPARSRVLRAISGVDVHRGGWGMVQGKCGCPECEIVVGGVHLDDDDVSPAPRPIAKSSCDDDAPTTPAFAAAAPATLPLGDAIPPRDS